MFKRRCEENWDDFFLTLQEKIIDFSCHGFFNGTELLDECPKCGMTLTQWFKEVEQEAEKRKINIYEAPY